MSFEKFIAGRYLKSKHKINFISVISLISIFGITIGVAALIVVLSIFNGFNKLVSQILINFDPHVKIESITSDGFSEFSFLDARILSNSDISSFSPFVKGKVVIYSNRLYRVINLQGIKSNVEKEFNGLRNSVFMGNYKLERTGNIPSILIGISLATRLQSLVGDTVSIISPVGLESVLTSFAPPRMQKFVITGIFDSNNKDFDGFYGFTSLKEAQILLGMRDKINGYEMRLNDIQLSNKVKEQFEGIINKNQMEVKTWFDLHSQLYSVMLIERWSAYIILSLIIAVAAFNIFGSLTMTVIAKKRDIGLMKSLGATEKSIMKIFLYEGILIGAIGTILGLVLGLVICYLQIKFKLYPLDSTVYIINALPVDIRWTDIFAVGFMSLFLSTLAGLIPAKKASKINPLEAIKWE